MDRIQTRLFILFILYIHVYLYCLGVVGVYLLLVVCRSL